MCSPDLLSLGKIIYFQFLPENQLKFQNSNLKFIDNASGIIILELGRPITKILQ